MAEFTAADVKRLRDATGAGMMDCKKALTEADGDFDKAVEFLRVKGAKDVGKRLERSTTNGVVVSKDGALLELDCETDFVAKNADFVALAERLLDIALQTKPADAEALLATESTARPSPRWSRASPPASARSSCSSRFAAFEGTDRVLPAQAGHRPARGDRCRRAVAGGARRPPAASRCTSPRSPELLTREEVPAETVETERRVAEDTAKEEGKPEEAIAKIVEGRVNAYFKDNVLLEQPSIAEPSAGAAVADTPA